MHKQRCSLDHEQQATAEPVAVIMQADPRLNNNGEGNLQAVSVQGCDTCMCCSSPRRARRTVGFRPAPPRLRTNRLQDVLGVGPS